MRWGAFGPAALVLTGVLALSACSGGDAADSGNVLSVDETAQHKATTEVAKPGVGKSVAGIPLCDLVSDETLTKIGLTRQDGKNKERAGDPSCHYDKKILFTVKVDYNSAVEAKYAPKGTRDYGSDKFGIIYESESSCQLVADIGKEKAEVVYEDLLSDGPKVKPCDISAAGLKDIIAKAK